jgi:hypothetical protein
MRSPNVILCCVGVVAVKFYTLDDSTVFVLTQRHAQTQPATSSSAKARAEQQAHAGCEHHAPDFSGSIKLVDPRNAATLTAAAASRMHVMSP